MSDFALGFMVGVSLCFLVLGVYLVYTGGFKRIRGDPK
jgi:hypothetical protein